jgi:hypothetical protein
VTDRYFSPEEVEALIPRLTDLMAKLRGAHTAAATARERLQAEQQRLTLAGGGVLDRAAWEEATQSLARETRRVEQAVTKINALGGVIKDIGTGLVDFAHLRDGRVVNLCWKLGETAIRFWHGMDEGFAARKPL